MLFRSSSQKVAENVRSCDLLFCFQCLVQVLLLAGPSPGLNAFRFVKFYVAIN